MLAARVKGRPDVSLLGRRLPDEVISRVVMVISLAVLWHVVGCIVLSITEASRGSASLHDLLFEQASAFGTVGLSTGITPTLSPFGKIWIIASMFVGRIGPLTAALAVLPVRASEVRYTEERLMIG
jgi:trk system potassium uptake protein TrkH